MRENGWLYRFMLKQYFHSSCHTGLTVFSRQVRSTVASTLHKRLFLAKTISRVPDLVWKAGRGGNMEGKCYHCLQTTSKATRWNHISSGESRNFHWGDFHAVHSGPMSTCASLPLMTWFYVGEAHTCHCIWIFPKHSKRSQFILRVKYIDYQGGWSKSMITHFAPDDSQTRHSRVTYCASNNRTTAVRGWGLN